ESLDVSIRLTVEGTPVVHDLMAGAERAVEAFSRDASTRTTRLRAPLTGGPMLIDFNRGAVDVFGERSGVTANAGLSVADVIARFEPARNDASLYRGTVWIDRKTFARIRVQAVQSGLSAPVVSNEEIQLYVPPVMVDGQPVHLLNGLTARQIMLIAGRNLLVEKSVTFEEVRVNEADFEDERGAARSSE